MKLISGEEEWPLLNPIAHDIRLLLSHFGEVKVEHRLRDCNRVADRIAKEALSTLNYVPKLYLRVPSWLKCTIENDGFV